MSSLKFSSFVEWITEIEIENEVLRMNDKQTSQQSDIRTQVIKVNVVGIHLNMSLTEIDNAIDLSRFASCMNSWCSFSL